MKKDNMNIKSIIRNTFSRGWLILPGLLFLSSCYYTDTKSPGYEYMPDMYRSPSYESNGVGPVFADSSANRKPVVGTVARGNYIYTDYDRLPYPFPETPEGYEAAGKDLHNPLERTEINMTEGKRLYENYCMVCHGEKGMGDGSVVAHGGPKPPAYNSDQLKSLPEGKAFHTTQFGKNMMGPYVSQLTATQRWKIIMYVQTLQQTSTAAPASDSTQNASVKKG